MTSHFYWFLNRPPSVNRPVCHSQWVAGLRGFTVYFLGYNRTGGPQFLRMWSYIFCLKSVTPSKLLSKTWYPLLPFPYRSYAKDLKNLMSSSLVFIVLCSFPVYFNQTKSNSRFKIEHNHEIMYFIWANISSILFKLLF